MSRRRKAEPSGCGWFAAICAALLLAMFATPALALFGGASLGPPRTALASGAVPYISEGSAYVWPIEGTGSISSRFGWRLGPDHGRGEWHAGLDIAAPTGTPVRAVAAGQIRMAGWQGNYGQLIKVRHQEASGATFETWYGHLSQIDVHEGDVVAAGQIIGLVGSTGRSTGPHLHLEYRTGNDLSPVDPQRLFNR